MAEKNPSNPPTNTEEFERLITRLARNFGLDTDEEGFSVRCTAEPEKGTHDPYKFQITLKAKSMNQTDIEGSLSRADVRALSEVSMATEADSQNSVIHQGGRLQVTPSVAARFFFESIRDIGKGSFGHAIDVMHFKAVKLRESYGTDDPEYPKRAEEFTRLFKGMVHTPNDLNGDFLNNLIADCNTIRSHSEFCTRGVFVNEYNSLKFIGSLVEGIKTEATPDNPEGRIPLKDATPFMAFFSRYHEEPTIFKARKTETENENRIFTLECPKRHMITLLHGLETLLHETAPDVSPTLKRNMVLAGALQGTIPKSEEFGRSSLVHEAKFRGQNLLGESGIEMYAFNPEKRQGEYKELLKNCGISCTQYSSPPQALLFQAPKDLMPVIRTFDATLKDRRLEGEAAAQAKLAAFEAAFSPDRAKDEMKRHKEAEPPAKEEKIFMNGWFSAKDWKDWFLGQGRHGKDKGQEDKSPG